MAYKHKRFISLLLLFTMLFTSIPIQSMIPQVAYGYIGDGQGSTNTTSNGAWRQNWRDTQQGVRLSIVDKDGNSVVTNKAGDPLAVDIMFAPISIGNNNHVMGGNKLQDPDGSRIKQLGIGEFNNLIANAIRNNPALWKEGFNGTAVSSKEEWEANCNLPWIQPYSTAYPSNYSGLSAPLVNSGGGVYKGNGEAIREFFLNGDLGTLTGPQTPSIDIGQIVNPSKPPSPPVSGGSSSGSGSTGSGTTGSGTTGSGTSTPAKPSQGAGEEKINTPYGLVTRTWLNDHIKSCASQPVHTLKNNGYMTSSVC